MSRSTEFTIDLKVNSDATLEALNTLEKGMKNVNELAKNEGGSKAFAKTLKDTQTAFESMTKNTSVDVDSVFKSYQKRTQETLKTLEKEYTVLRDQANERANLEKELEKAVELQKKQTDAGEDTAEITRKIEEQTAKLNELKTKNIDAQIKENKELRASIVETTQRGKVNAAITKREQAIEKLRAKLKKESSLSERSALKEQIKVQELSLKALREQGKELDQNAQKLKISERLWKSIQKGVATAAKNAPSMVAGATHFAYNAAGLAGGMARTGKAVVGAISSGVSMVAGSADDLVERERQANRIKGYSSDEKTEIMRQLFIQTGADYSSIVEAINRVQGTLGSGAMSKDELIANAAVELRYPGASQAIASTGSATDANVYQMYANKMRALQNATGASDEQIAQSSSMMANLRASSFGSARVTELQSIYLALQNSGAFDSQDELDNAFKRFVRVQRDSNENPFEFAKKYDWTRGIYDQRNRIQAENTLQNISWDDLAKTSVNDYSSTTMTAAEQMSMRMRELEERKNELLMKLIPAVMPLVDGLANMLQGEGAQKLIDNLTSMFMTVVPLLEPVLDLLNHFLNVFNTYILTPLRSMVEKALNWLGGEEKQAEANGEALPKNANGGLAFMPSIVGERGPEAIIPLDYSRNARASNIATNITQTFNMSGSQTTALSLSQAVRSRDFSRAMMNNSFISQRGGAF